MSDDLAELFNLEIDEFNKKSKSEEEIQKMCTKDNLTELERATYLLRKGYEIQKQSVINNLHRYTKEVGANEELLSLIIISLEDWDNKMQIDCAQAFLQPIRDQVISKENKQRLLQACMTIITNEANENQTLKDSWMRIYDLIVGSIDFDYVQLVVLKPIQTLADRKSTFNQRKLANRLLFSLVKQCGEAAIDQDRSVLRLVLQICGDTNYKLRLDGAVFFREYIGMNFQSLKSSSRLETSYVPEIIELCNDEDPNIQIEAIEALHFVIETLQIDLIRKEVIPPLLKLLRSDYEEIQIRLAHFIGSLVFKLSQVENLHLEYQDELMEFYKSLCWSKVDQCRQHAVYSFPCFQSLYGRNYSQKPTFQSKQPVERTCTGVTASTTYDVEESKADDDSDQAPFEFHSIFYQFATDQNDQVRVTAALCIHEGFLASDSAEDTTTLREALSELLQDECPAVMQALVKNLAISFEHYANEYTIKNFSNFDQEPHQLLPPLGLKEKSSASRRSKLSKQFVADFDAQPLPQSQYLYMQEHQSEQVYSILLQKVLVFKANLVKKIAFWREAVTLYQSLALQLHKFHQPEVHDKLVPIIFEDLKRGNTQLRQSACQCLARLIASQHDSGRRLLLVQQVSVLSQANYQMRKCFILFCQEAVGILTRFVFEQNFYERYIKLAADDIAQIRLDFINSLLLTKTYLDYKPQINSQLHDIVCRLKKDPNAAVADLMDQVDYDIMRTRKKAAQQLQEKDDKNVIKQKRLEVREVLEMEERKKLKDDEQLNGYEQYLGVGAPYGTTNRIGGKIMKRTHAKTSLPSSKMVTVSAATVRRIQGAPVTGGDTKVATLAKRKIITSYSKRQSSALPELNQQSSAATAELNKQTKTSILLPGTTSQQIFEKQQVNTIPGMPQRDDQLKRYSKIAPVTSSQQQQAYKRSNSLMQPVQTKSKLVQKKRDEAATAAAYQKQKNSSKPTSMLLQSDSSSSSSSLDDFALDNHSSALKKPIRKTFMHLFSFNSTVERLI